MKNWNDVNAALQTLARYAVAVVAGLIICTNAIAQNVGTALSDLWWNAAEAGWGVTIDHQQDVMFLTFFVYRSDGSPYWVTATLQKIGSNPLSAPPLVFTGDVYETHGPSFGVPFNPAQVTYRKVGTATFTGNLWAATLQYSIDGVNVTKNIVRQTLRNLNLTSLYLGGTVYTFGNCKNPSNNNVTIADAGSLTIIQSGTSLQIAAKGQSLTCSFNGTYSQQGSLGEVAGNYSCVDGTTGTFTMYGMQWTVFGMTAGIIGRNQSCDFEGYLGGITNGHAK